MQQTPFKLKTGQAEMCPQLKHIMVHQIYLLQGIL